MEIDINSLLGLPMMEVIDFSFTEKKVLIVLRRVTESELCPLCNCPCTVVRSYPKRKVRDLDILGRKTYLTIESRQFECKTCKRYFNEDLGIVQGNHGLTKRYESYLYGMIKGINIQQICLKEDVCWATLNAIHKSYSTLELSSRHVDWSKVKRISIDEIAVRKGKRNFACVLRDPDSDIVLDMLEKRDMATLKAYFTETGVDFCNQVENVISDMWDAYVNLAGEKGIFKNAINVIDLFHFVQHLGTALDGERKAARKAFPESECLKLLRWTILKSPEDLNEAESLHLKEAFKISENLGKIYQLRIDLRAIFQKNHTKETGLDAINEWEEEAKKIDSKPLAKFLITVNNWKGKVANFFIDRVTNAGMEGTNNHIRSIIRRAFGYVDFQTLRRRVLTECGDVPY
jgi:transposase